MIETSNQPEFQVFGRLTGLPFVNNAVSFASDVYERYGKSALQVPLVASTTKQIESQLEKVYEYAMDKHEPFLRTIDSMACEQLDVVEGLLGRQQQKLSDLKETMTSKVEDYKQQASTYVKDAQQQALDTLIVLEQRVTNPVNSLILEGETFLELIEESIEDMNDDHFDDDDDEPSALSEAEPNTEQSPIVFGDAIQHTTFRSKRLMLEAIKRGCVHISEGQVYLGNMSNAAILSSERFISVKLVDALVFVNSIIGLDVELVLEEQGDPEFGKDVSNALIVSREYLELLWILFAAKSSIYKDEVVAFLSNQLQSSRLKKLL